MLSLVLLALQPYSALFVIVYLLCGLTDALDGYIARAYDAQSDLGAYLDGAADMTFFVVVFFVLVTTISIPFIILFWAVCIILARLFGLALSYSRYHRFALLHTYANKITAFVFFLFPLSCALLGVEIAGAAMCGIASYAIGEEIYIHARSATLNLDVRSARYLEDPSHGE